MGSVLCFLHCIDSLGCVTEGYTLKTFAIPKGSLLEQIEPKLSENGHENRGDKNMLTKVAKILTNYNVGQCPT